MGDTKKKQCLHVQSIVPDMDAETLIQKINLGEDEDIELKEIVADNYCQLTELERIILVLAHKFDQICNTDVQRYRQEHPKDIGECLKHLVNQGWLKSFGRARGTYYTLLNKDKADDLLSLLSNSEHNEPNSEHNKTLSLMEIAASVRDKKRVSPELMQATILKLCLQQFSGN